MEEKFYIENKIEELPSLAEKIEGIGEKWDLPMPLVMNLNLVLEEAVTNTIFYSYADTEIHRIEIELKKEDKQLIIRITDDGNPFDPTKKEKPDTSLSIEDRKIGGLGIFLIQQLMDQVNYKREENKNILILKKSI